jgi:hypothetical protein
MPDSQVTQTGDQGDKTQTTTQAPSLGWRAGLPDDLKEHEAFKSFKTVGEFAKSHLDTAKKATDLEKKLEDSIPKLPDDATQEERDVYQMSLGRPEKAEEYELAGDGKDAPEWTNYWKGELFKLGVSKDTAKALSQALQSQIKRMVEAHNTSIKKEIEEASTKLKAEWGDKYEANVQLAQRLWKAHTDSDFDKAFTGETSANRFQIMRYLVKMAAKTGEDTSLPGAVTSPGGRPERAFISYDKSPAPPKRS